MTGGTGMEKSRLRFVGCLDVRSCLVRIFISKEKTWLFKMSHSCLFFKNLKFHISIVLEFHPFHPLLETIMPQIED